MKKMIIASLALVAIGSVAASAETVQCPTTAAPGACAENQAIHDAFLAGSAWGDYPVFAYGPANDNRSYAGSDPDINVRLALLKATLNGGGMGAAGTSGK